MSTRTELWTQLPRSASKAVTDGLDDLFGALRIPSISSQTDALRQSANYLESLLARDGWSAEVVEIEGNPIVFAEIGPEGGPAILLYGHHDVQPTDPEVAWVTPPFEPTIREGSVYGRGSADNKGQFFCHLFAVRALSRESGSLGVRIKLVLDGQEEVGSPQLERFIDRMRSRLEGASLCLTADGPTRLEPYPEVVFGVRGSVQMRLDVRTSLSDLHSGNWGNIVPSAAWSLAYLLASMQGEDGRVTVQGFYDDVVPPTDAERAALAAIPFNKEEALASIGHRQLKGPSAVPPLERLMFQPSFTVTGMNAGYTGPGFKAVIPAAATALIDVRIVVDQNPEKIFERVREHLARIAPEATLEMIGRYLPSRTAIDEPVAERVVAAVARGFGQQPLRVPRMGGSLPDGAFASKLGVPVLRVPYGPPDQANHAPNEHMRLQNLRMGTLTSAAMFLEMAPA